MLGLLHSIEQFDVDAGVRLSTYATWWIRQAITRAIADKDRTIGLPVHRVEAIARYVRAVRQLEQNLKRKPTDEEVAISLNLVSPRVIADLAPCQGTDVDRSSSAQSQLRRAVRHIQALQRYADLQPASLDVPVGDDEESSLGDYVPDGCLQSPETIAFQHALCDEVDGLLDGLSVRERRVIIHRFGLDDSETLTLEALGQDLGVTRERIRQIEAKGLLKLRHPLRARRLRDFIDYTPSQTPPKADKTTDQGDNDEYRGDPVPEPQSGTEVTA